jgi:hypothetical protein
MKKLRNLSAILIVCVVGLGCPGCENAGRVEVTIGRGPSVDVTLDETPSEKWRSDLPEQTSRLEKRGNELWHIMDNGSSICGIHGGASHPAFVARD